MRRLAWSMSWNAVFTYRSSTFAFSNLGSIGPPLRFGDVAIEDLTVFMSPSTVELGIVTSTMANRLTLNVSYAEPLLPRHLAERLLHHLEALIEESILPAAT